MKFNLTRAKPRKLKTNLAGGQAWRMSDKLELITLLLTSFLEPQFYRKASDSARRVLELVSAIPDKGFIARAAIYARTRAGMRSVTHLVAAELAARVKGEAWMKTFLNRVVHRPDDVLEIMACYLAMHGRPLPNSMKKGLGAALTRFDHYQLAKYRRDGAGLKMVDAVNLLHPPHTEALARLVKGELKPADTWETRLTQAGQEAGSEKERVLLKSRTWASLVQTRKIGYFALLRNLRNILQQCPEVTEDALRMLTDENLIRRSLVMPFRYRTALDAIEAASLPKSHLVMEALSRAVDLSLANVPVFPGRTLIAVDCSGSMVGRPMKIASLFAAVLYRVNEADVMLFSNQAQYGAWNKRDSTLSVARQIESRAVWGGTNFHAVFEKARPGYDRIVILSDMQGWMGTFSPTISFAKYCNRSDSSPKVYSFDLAGYGTLQFPEQNVYCLAGFSDQTMETLKMLDRDSHALIHQVESIAL